MKRLIVILFIFSLIIGNLFCEETSKRDSEIKNEAYLSIGTVSGIGLISGFAFAITDAIGNSLKEEEATQEDKPFEAFSINLGYNLFLIDFLGLGGFLNFERVGSMNLISAQLKVTAQYGWTHFKFYHALSGGVLFIDDDSITPMFDVTILGLKFDFENFNIFLEASLPSTAMLKLGAGYYF